MKIFLIISGIVVVAVAAVYFGFVPIKGIPRGKCTVDPGTGGAPSSQGFYAFGKCAT